MRRAAAGLVCLGLLGAGALALGIGSIAGAAPAPKVGCTWHLHSKRVVRHVRRHGQVRRVRRMKHWWTCDPQPAGGQPESPAGGPPAEEPKPEVSHLGVKAVEWSYTLSRPEVTAGEVIVELNNQGEDNHNLKLQREGSGEPPFEVAEAAPEEHTTSSFTLPPGTYHLYCSLFEHDKKGMHATLVVTGG